MDEEQVDLTQSQTITNQAPDYESLLPDELTDQEAYKLLGQTPPPSLETAFPQMGAILNQGMPEEIPAAGAEEFVMQNGLDTNIDPSNLPEELDFAQADDLVRKLGTQSMGVGVPEVGSHKSSGLATWGFYGPIPQLQGGRISQGFRAKVNYEKSGEHGGIDLAAPKGTPIPSTDAGEVVSVEDHGKKGFGKSVVIKNADGSYSRYSHLNDFKVRQGQKIKPGDIIGGVGNTGHVISLGAGGYHLDLRRTR